MPKNTDDPRWGLPLTTDWQDFRAGRKPSLLARIRQALTWVHEPQPLTACPDCRVLTHESDLAEHRRRTHGTRLKQPRPPTRIDDITGPEDLRQNQRRFRFQYSGTPEPWHPLAVGDRVEDITTGRLGRITGLDGFNPRCACVVDRDDPRRWYWAILDDLRPAPTDPTELE